MGEPLSGRAPRPPAETYRGHAERTVRRLLFVGEEPRRVREDAIYRLFHLSMVLSGLRCLLSYVVLPFVLPLAGVAARVGPAVGIPVAAVALLFDVRGLRRFWLADHRWKWAMTFVYAAVMALVVGLLVADLVHLAT